MEESERKEWKKEDNLQGQENMGEKKIENSESGDNSKIDENIEKKEKRDEEVSTKSEENVPEVQVEVEGVQTEQEKPVKKEVEVIKEKPKKEPINFNEFYNKNFKKLIILPLSLLLISLILIGVQVASTGDFIHKDVSLKGGVTITIPLEAQLDVLTLETGLKGDFSNNDISVRSIKKSGQQIGIIISADIDGTKEEQVNSLINSVEKNLDVDLSNVDFTTEIVGSTLGASFFQEIIKVLIIAFIFMGFVVFLYFRKWIPCGAIILAAFSDILVTLAVVNLIGMKLSTAGIAAFLMLIGYAVDTNILLSTKLLKRKEGTINERIKGAFTTGMTMTVTTLSAIGIALIFTQAGVIKQIMSILLIGLLVDVLNTWVQNASILKWYLERKNE